MCIDIGGTKTLVALFSKRGRIIRRKKFKTAHGYRTFISNLMEVLAEFKKYKVKSIVVAIPGVVQENYSVSFGNRNWSNIDIVTPIKSLFDCPIYFENDASLGALYEAYRLAGRTMFLTFSTGVGGGLIEKNRILPESSELEPGHKIYSYQGKTAEWEDISAASAIENFYHVDHATDLRGKEIMQDIAQRIYLGLPELVEKYHPDTIVLGGPLGKIFKLYVGYIPKIENVRYKRPKRPNESAIYGCYLLARQKERE